jgi:hypothetical protein
MPKHHLALKTLACILLFILSTHVCSAQTNVLPEAKTVHPLTNLTAAVERSMFAATRTKPLARLILTNYATQDEILAVVDTVNANQAIDGYVDGYCGFGARLGRHYLGQGCLVTVDFNGGKYLDLTAITLYGTKPSIGKAWREEMSHALRKRFGDTVDDGQKK